MLYNGTGYTLVKGGVPCDGLILPQCLGDDKVDMSGSADILGGLGLDPGHVRSDSDFLLRVVPEPMSVDAAWRGPAGHGCVDSPQEGLSLPPAGPLGSVSLAPTPRYGGVFCLPSGSSNSSARQSSHHEARQDDQPTPRALFLPEQGPGAWRGWSLPPSGTVQPREAVEVSVKMDCPRGGIHLPPVKEDLESLRRCHTRAEHTAHDGTWTVAPRQIHGGVGSARYAICRRAGARPMKKRSAFSASGCPSQRNYTP